MDALQSMKIFVRVAQRSSFAASARELRLSPGAVTKHIAALEERLGARLLDRTTRKVSMTEAGRVYFERCLECLQAFEDADSCAKELSSEPRGTLRITAPHDFQSHLSTLLGPFIRAHPKVTLDVQLSNRSVSLVEEGFDLAIRCAPALEGQFVARPFALIHMMMWASPDYLRRHGRPRRPEDLANHRTIAFAEPRPLTNLTFTKDREQVAVTLAPTLTSNSGGVLTAALCDGLAIGMVPSFLSQAYAQAGAIEPVLVDWSLPVWKAFAIYPHRRFLAPAVRALVDQLRATYGDGTRDPWLDHQLTSLRRERADGSPGRRSGRARARS